MKARHDFKTDEEYEDYLFKHVAALEQHLEDIHTIMWESYMIKSRRFDMKEGLKIMKVLTKWCKR